MKSDNFACRACKDTDSTLQVHHKRYRNGADPWDYPDDQLMTLCNKCHKEIHGLTNETELTHRYIPITCASCGSLVTNAQGYGRTESTYWCEECVNKMEADRVPEYVKTERLPQ